MVSMKAFSKFENTTEALAAAATLVDSKVGKNLKKFLSKHAEGETLGVADSKLGAAIKDKLGINCVADGGVMELMRGVRFQLNELIGGLTDADLAPMALGLSHSLSRYKLKFSPDKVDTMVIQAIGLLDELDKELNTYSMRVRERGGPDLSPPFCVYTYIAQTSTCPSRPSNAASLSALLTNCAIIRSESPSV